jgi:uncharacterized protein (DUF58 family)
MLNQVSGALTHDFCPWANRYVYWLKRPIGWVFLAFLSSILLGIYVSPQAFLATAGIAMVAIIGSLWPWISMLGVRGELSWNALRCEELESIETDLVVTNRWPWPVYGLSLDLEGGMLPEGWDKQRISLQRIPGLAKSKFHWSTVPQTRGEYPRKPVELQSAFPFGIWTSRRPVRVPEPLLVWPRVTRLVDAPSDMGSQQFGTGSVSDRVGDEGDWTGVRPYRPGDSLRQVHWAQTARRDSLVVFERQSSASQSVLLQLDLDQALIASESTLEAMLRLLASLTNQFLLHHWSVYVDLEGRFETTGIAERLVLSQRIRFMDRLSVWDPRRPSEQSDVQTRRSIQKVSPNVALKIRWNDEEGDLSHIEGTKEDRRVYCFAVIPEAPIAGAWDDELQAAWRAFCRSQQVVHSDGQARVHGDPVTHAMAHASGGA